MNNHLKRETTEFVPYEADERLMMIETYINSVNPAFLTDEIYFTIECFVVISFLKDSKSSPLKNIKK